MAIVGREPVACVPAGGVGRESSMGHFRLIARGLNVSNTSPTRAAKVWIKKMQGQACKDVFVFFKHEDEAKGPRMAVRLMELLGKV